MQKSGPWDPQLLAAENSQLLAQRAHSAWCAPFSELFGVHLWPRCWVHITQGHTPRQTKTVSVAQVRPPCEADGAIFVQYWKHIEQLVIWI